jgi:aryl-alcohol dehydrogenase-like predicted oxidoreductase
MKQRRIGPLEVSAIGLGCMNLSHAYGVPPSPEDAEKVLLTALDLGVTLFDTAALYGFGANESLLGRVLAPHRSKIVLASKCGMTGVNGVRVIDNRPETLRRTCEESLQRLRTDVIDLYYLHRFDRKVPIEESVGALADLVRAGKVRALGLSEVSAATLRRAHAVHPISALQSEYSLWSRNPEIAGLAACRELGTSLVAFSPIARGFLSGRLREVGTLDAKDIRRNMPRFQPAAFDANLSLLPAFAALADEADCTPAQLALAWLLAQDDRLVPIPGTTRAEHLAENLGAATVRLDAAMLARVDAAIDRHAVTGSRYNATTQAEIDSEEYPA